MHPTHWVLGAAYVELGDMQQAIKHLRIADSLSGHTDGFRGYLAYAYGLSGDTSRSRAILRELTHREALRSSGKIAMAIALTYIGLGATDSAFHWTNVAYERRSSVLSFILLAPPGRRLASDPRYHAAMRRLRLSTIPEPREASR